MLPPRGGRPAGTIPSMQPHIVLLGTGTCQLQERRMASSVLVELPDLRFVFDFGRGIALRLVQQGLRQDEVEHVVLSHFHPDHLSDLIPYLHAACWSQVDPRHRDLHIYGPPGLEVQLMRLLSLFGPHDLSRPEHFRVHLHEIHDSCFAIGRHRLEVADLPPAGNRGIKLQLGDLSCALTGDSGFHTQEIEFLRDVDLAVIDAGHLSDDEIVDLAAGTQVRTLVCSHLYRELDAAELQTRAGARGYRGRLLVGEDGMVLPAAARGVCMPAG